MLHDFQVANQCCPKPFGKKELAISATEAERQGPLSWQQEARLRNEHKYGNYLPIENIFLIPDHVTDRDLHARLRRVVDREDSLHIVDATMRDGGWVTYRPDLPLPLRYETCESFADIRAAASAATSGQFNRDGRPLWEVVVLKYADPAGRITRHACCVFDHLVSDGRSMHLLQNELMGDVEANAASRGRYADWVNWQSQEFPRSGGRRTTPTREFWLRHLDGTLADRPTPVPFAISSPVGGGGLLTTTTVDLPIQVTALREAAQALRATPFLLVFANAVSWIARATSVSDVTTRIISNGRPLPYLCAQGWFADSLPVRMRDPKLADPARALSMARQILSQMLRFPYQAPWEYIRTACAPDNIQVSEETGRGQLVINVLPHASEGVLAESECERTVPGDIDGLHMLVLGNATGRCRLQAVFNPDDFSLAGVRMFLEDLAQQLTEISAAH
ncbi:MAG TPA: condensation domain-containing protein [Streptosporangiaceae bacterium]|nr:condensation domain-containing protein [Streptosporangiaceae bacterium]